MFSTSTTPDLSTKPRDIEEYAFAPVCELDHVTGYGQIRLSTKDLETITACSQCGRAARYQTIKRYAEAVWVERVDMYRVKKNEPTQFYWTQRYGFTPDSILWTRAERVSSISLT
jgi:hypothetical protein